VNTRQEGATDRTNTRTEAIEDTYHDAHWDNGEAAAAGFVAGAVVGTAAVAASTTVVALPCSATVVSTGGVNYYVCGTTYYTQAYSGGSVVYVQTAPPQGH